MMIRQDFKCASCSFSYTEAFIASQRHLLRWMRKDILTNIKYIKKDIPFYRDRLKEGESSKELDDWEKRCREDLLNLLAKYFQMRRDRSFWSFRTSDRIRAYHRAAKDHREPEVGHIIPVKLSGMAIGFDNVQILCYMCHKQKTLKDNRDIRNHKKH